MKNNVSRLFWIFYDQGTLALIQCYRWCCLFKNATEAKFGSIPIPVHLLCVKVINALDAASVLKKKVFKTACCTNCIC